MELGVEFCVVGVPFFSFSIYFLAPSDHEYFSAIFDFFSCVFFVIYLFVPGWCQ